MVNLVSDVHLGAYFSFQIFKGTFHYCEGNRGHVTNKTECLNDSGRWENHMYNFDNLPNVIWKLNFSFSLCEVLFFCPNSRLLLGVQDTVDVKQ